MPLFITPLLTLDTPLDIFCHITLYMLLLRHMMLIYWWLLWWFSLLLILFHWHYITLYYYDDDWYAIFDAELLMLIDDDYAITIIDAAIDMLSDYITYCFSYCHFHDIAFASCWLHIIIDIYLLMLLLFIAIIAADIAIIDITLRRHWCHAFIIDALWWYYLAFRFSPHWYADDCRIAAIYFLLMLMRRRLMPRLHYFHYILHWCSRCRYAAFALMRYFAFRFSRFDATLLLRHGYYYAADFTWLRCYCHWHYATCWYCFYFTPLYYAELYLLPMFHFLMIFIIFIYFDFLHDAATLRHFCRAAIYWLCLWLLPLLLSPLMIISRRLRRSDCLMLTHCHFH